MTIRVPVYSAFEVIKWPTYSNADRIAQLAHYCHATNKCPYCRSETSAIERYCDNSAKDSTLTYVRLCGTCGFWFGRGTRGYLEGPAWGRFILGKVTEEPLDSPTIDTEQLIRFLNENSAYLSRIDPFKAEDLVAELRLRGFNSTLARSTTCSEICLAQMLDSLTWLP
jgi:hypothetical protein